MKQIYREFVSHIDTNIGYATDRSRIIALAVALAVSNASPLPTTEVDSPVTYFTNMVMPEASKVINGFNESAVFDCRASFEYLRSLWMLRYNAAHPSTIPTSAVYEKMDYGFVATIFNTAMFISPEMHKFANENKKYIIPLAAVIAKIIAASRTGE